VEKKASNAANPPAEAPIPTIGNPAQSGSAGLSTGSGFAALSDALAVSGVSAKMSSPGFPASTSLQVAFAIA
jgi:hypothetical protein